MLLALDLATATGWAAWAPGKPVAYGTRHFAPGADLGPLLHQFEWWLADKMNELKVDHVVHEAAILPPGSGISSRMKLFTLIGVAHLVAWRQGVTVDSYAVSQWRSHFIGKLPREKGETKPHYRLRLKQATVDACQLRGWAPRDDNAADALGLLDYTAQRAGMPIDWPRTPLEAA